MKKPIFGTNEWAEKTVDIDRGCVSGCRYCYAKAEAARFKRHDPRHWQEPVARGYDALTKLCHSKTRYRVMFPAHHDITADNVGRCRTALRSLLDAGHDVLIVSKPSAVAITRLFANIKHDSPEWQRITVRFSIGSANQATLSFWEPGAPSLLERLWCLKYCFDIGLKTSVSMEPMLDNMPERVIDLVRPYINDAIWLGLPNFLIQRLAINKEPKDVIFEGRELLASFTDTMLNMLFLTYGPDPQIRWKDSLKKRLGLKLATKAGEDR